MARDHRRWPRTVPDRGRRRPRVPARHNRRSRCGAATARDVRSRRLPRGRPGLPLGRQFLQPAHPAGRSGRHASMKVLSMFNHERVDRGIATPAERLAVAALDEMPDEDDDAVRAWAPSAAFRRGDVEAVQGQEAPIGSTRWPPRPPIEAPGGWSSSTACWIEGLRFMVGIQPCSLGPACPAQAVLRQRVHTHGHCRSLCIACQDSLRRLALIRCHNRDQEQGAP